MGEDADNTFGFPRGDFHFKKRCSRNRKPPQSRDCSTDPGRWLSGRISYYLSIRGRRHPLATAAIVTIGARFEIPGVASAQDLEYTGRQNDC